MQPDSLGRHKQFCRQREFKVFQALVNGRGKFERASSWLHAKRARNEELIANRLAHPVQRVTDRRGSYRKYLARLTHTAMQLHISKYPEQTEVEHANCQGARLRIFFA